MDLAGLLSTDSHKDGFAYMLLTSIYVVLTKRQPHVLIITHFQLREAKKKEVDRERCLSVDMERK